MGSGKKEANRKVRQGKTGDGMANVKMKGENFYRDQKKVKTLNMFSKGKARRNAAGDITQAAIYQSKETPNARIEPNRKWFTNTRVIAQDSLTSFREAVEKNQSDPYSFLLKQNKLPMSLIRDNTKNGVKQHEAKIAVEQRPFQDTFGPKAQRKRVKLDVSSLQDLAGHSEKMHDQYLDRREQAQLLSGNAAQAEASGDGWADVDDGNSAAAREPIFSKGQSKRIYNELYKVIDSSDVIIHVLDARDPEGTRCRSIEKYIQEEAPHKNVLFVLNKCDLVPTNIAAQWVRTLSKERPTLAFHASINNSYGKGSLIQVLRQFRSLHSNRKQISVGIIGYPNTGKSSIINTLRKKKVCTVAPIPGETKVWQYVTLMKSIYLIDCPGVVPPNQNDTDADILLRGVVRIENVQNPEQYVAAALQKCQKKHILRTYELKEYADHIDLLEQLARKSGKLMKGGEADVDGVAKSVLNDFLRGKIPWFVPPKDWTPKDKRGKSAAEGAEEEGGRTGDLDRLNKIGMQDLRAKKRKRDEADVEGEDDNAGQKDHAAAEEDEDDEDEFQSFSVDDGEEEGVEVSSDQEDEDDDA
ncbi:hypothetical protein FH972_021228 [Carpinus fangiana]|uniref:Nuclear/nucleolar GTPase 2 n=1 Tax=Carpinus fangiana TaxID=176857 RepID=A0A5N6KP43_9ROSI|nr:hypothetical protein FH972_021228 [Carpinus fangiana]